MSDNLMNADDDEAFAEATLTQAVENQIESDNPPAAKATFNKQIGRASCRERV